MAMNFDDQLQQRYKQLRSKVSITAADWASYAQTTVQLDLEKLWSKLLHLATAPVIWLGLIPAALMDLFVSLYQKTCFPVYGIKQAKRSDFIFLDRENLSYLSRLERINCAYCSYFNGVAAYTKEVAARTERYFCPLKHRRDRAHPHHLYSGFAEYGDESGFRRKLNGTPNKS